MKRIIMFMFIIALVIAIIVPANAQKSRALSPNTSPLIYKKTLCTAEGYAASGSDTLPRIASSTWGQSLINLSNYELDLGGTSYCALKTVWEDSCLMYIFLEYKDKDSSTWIAAKRDTIDNTAESAGKYVSIIEYRSPDVNYIDDPDAIYRLVFICPSTASKQGVDRTFSSYVLWKP